MNKKVNIIITFGIILIFCLFLFFLSCNIQKRQEQKIANLENMIANLKDELIPIKFKAEKKNDKTFIRLLFLDLAGNKIKDEKLSLTGNEIHFDFQVVKLCDKKIASGKNKNQTSEQFLFYPYKIYSENIKPNDGIDLCRLYNKNNFPSIYKGFESFLNEDNKKYSNAYSKKLTQTFEYILNDELGKLAEQFGSAVHNMPGISEFKKGYTYSIVCHPHTGGIEIRSE
ncbi:MAG: hypothetical protein UHW86_03375 [Spirochaetota bacterium]|nr:hypothetical protein [Spirochaetota bacterium]